MPHSIEVPCFVCEKLVLTSPRRLRRSKSGRLFCGQLCLARWKRGRPLVERETTNCATCNQIIEVAPHHLHKHKRNFCNDTCQANYFEVEVSCKQCGETIRRRRKEVEQMTQGPFCSSRCHGIWVTNNDMRSGDRNPAWNGGYSSPDYGSHWKRQRRKARDRDNHTCQDCGITEQAHGYKLDVHHLIPYDMFDDPEEANDLGNLITLCRPCHVKRHQGLDRATLEKLLAMEAD